MFPLFKLSRSSFSPRFLLSKSISFIVIGTKSAAKEISLCLQSKIVQDVYVCGYKRRI